MGPNVIQNVADHYAQKYDLMDHLSDLKELIKNMVISHFTYFDIY